MKKSKLMIFLAVEAVVCILACITQFKFAAVFSSILAFPFEQIGMLLRALSLSGFWGNVAAVLLYLCVCLAPVAYYFRRTRKGPEYRDDPHPEDILLIILAAALFAALYMMINPADIGKLFGSYDFVSIGKTMIGTTVYSILSGYIMLRVLRVFKVSGAGSLLKYLNAIMTAICAALVFGIFGNGLNWLVETLRQFIQANTAPGQYGVSYVFIVLQYTVKIMLPYALEIGIVFCGFDLVSALEREPYSEETIMAAQKLSRICRISVVTIMVSQILLNVLQLVFASSAQSSDFGTVIPLMQLAFVLIALLLATYFEQGKTLKDDNDMFV